MPPSPPPPFSSLSGAQKAFTKAFISTGISADIRTDFMNFCRECPSEVPPAALMPPGLVSSPLLPLLMLLL